MVKRTVKSLCNMYMYICVCLYRIFKIMPSSKALAFFLEMQIVKAKIITFYFYHYCME